jgi:site-specific DNA-methyltransferase (adenine-specific)
MPKIVQFSDSNQKILLGDCLPILKKMEDEYVDLTITSPPYNIGVKYNSYKDNKGRKEYLLWLMNVFTEVNRITKNSGALFLNVGSTNKDPWIAMDVAQVLRDIWVLQNHIVWVKSLSVGEKTFGHFKPISSKRFVNHLYEHIFHFTKKGVNPIDRTATGIGVPYADKSNIKRWCKKSDIRCRGDVWFIPYKTINTKKQKGEHPAIFPEKLVEMCIRLHGFNKDLVVLEPFLGTGTTLVVTKAMGIEGIGIDIDKFYTDFAIERLSEISLFEEGKPL